MFAFSMCFKLTVKKYNANYSYYIKTDFNFLHLWCVDICKVKFWAQGAGRKIAVFQRGTDVLVHGKMAIKDTNFPLLSNLTY